MDHNLGQCQAVTGCKDAATETRETCGKYFCLTHVDWHGYGLHDLQHPEKDSEEHSETLADA